MDGLLQRWPTPDPPFDDLDEWPQAPTTASAMEGVEASPHAEAQPASAKHLGRRPPVSGRPRARGYWRIAGSKVLAVTLPNGYWAPLSTCRGFSAPIAGVREC